MSEVKKRRMIHLKVEPKSSQSTSESSKIFQQTISINTTTDEVSVDEEPEIFYNFDSDEELHDNPLKFSRSPSPTDSTHSCKSDKEIFKLKDDLQRIANDPVTCTTTLNTVLGALHNYFPWLPDNANLLRNKMHDEVVSSEPNKSSTQNTVKTESSSIIITDRNIQYVMIENKELEAMKKNIEAIKEGQKELLKEFKCFRQYQPLRLNENAYKFKLPFSDLDVFMKFDKDLLTDQETKEQLIKIYMREVEFDPQKYIKKNLRKLFTTDVAMKFSFRGRQGNMRADKTNTIQILRDCTDQLYPQTCKDLFERCATNFFYSVKDKITKAQKVSRNRNLQISDVNTVEFVLPFNELESLKSFDASLVKDSELAQQLKLMYLEEAVTEYKRFLLNNFRKMFTNELACKLNLTDKQSDFCIREFNVIKIMKGCLLEKYPATNENNFYNCGKQYLGFVKQKALESQTK